MVMHSPLRRATLSSDAPLPTSTRQLDAHQRPPATFRGARLWAALAVGSLVGAGVLSLLLVIGRLPPFDALFTDEAFFHRALVVHVVLAIVVWFLAFTVGLFHLLPSTGAAPPWCRAAPHLAFAGLLAMGAATFFPEATPVLANYIPVLDHPIFLAGLIAFGAAVLLALLGPRLAPSTEAEGSAPVPSPIPPEARPGLRAAAIAILLGALTLLSSWWSLSPHQPADAYYERLVWGGGHVLQFASVAAMVAMWQTLLRPIVGRPIVSRRVSTVLFALLVTPLFVAPLLADTNDPGSRMFFTRLMELAIFPVVTIFLILCLVALARHRAGPGVRPLRDPRTLAFAVSATLTVLGFALGAAIDGSNTLVPAHYHAAIGAVTAIFMGATHVLGRHFGLAPYTPRGQRLARWQPLVFGVGQMVFAAGFAIAGAAGMARKTYGTEQVAVTDATQKTVGLVVMGVGGVIAVVGGLTFLVLVLGAWRRARVARGSIR